MTKYGIPKAIIIAGPTASGKTSLSVALALALEGEIVNSDSMQVYRGMDIGTAKPTIAEQKGIPHHLLDVVNPDEAFNAAVYRSMALPLVKEIASRAGACFVVGGTGLYVKSLLEGLFDCPAADQEFRKSLHREYETSGPGGLYERLKALDPESAGNIHPNDKIRVIRALEIIHLTHRLPSELFGKSDSGDRPINALKICLDVDREKLYERINKRSVVMVESGLIEETEGLLNRGYSSELKPMKSIGYRHTVQYLAGDWSLDETIENIQKDTRRYAKRQLTWFRADSDVVWAAPQDFALILDKVRTFIRKAV